MTRNILTTTATLAILAATVTTANAQSAGLRLFDIDMPHHGQEALAALWYPADSDGTETVFAGNPVFQGVAARENATVAEGTYPVFLLSHGMGGGIESTAWLASALAERGAVVIAVNHINTTWRAFDMSEGIAHWTRAQDLTQALDTVFADPALEGHLDPDRIMAAGFSYGGWSALSLGGARGNHDGAVSACEEHAGEMELCDMLMSPKVDMPGVDPALWNADYSDPRVTHVAALDPGFVWGPVAEDLDGLVGEVLLIGLGDADTRLDATDFDRSGFAGFLPDAKVERIVPAVHFTGMPLCTNEGAAILESEADDPVCTDPEGTDRAAAHDRIVGLLADQIGL